MSRRGVFASSLALLAVAGGAIVSLNVTGFCYSQPRSLSDTDLSRQAILYSLRKSPREESDVIQLVARFERIRAKIEVCPRLDRPTPAIRCKADATAGTDGPVRRATIAPRHIVGIPTQPVARRAD